MGKYLVQLALHWLQKVFSTLPLETLYFSCGSQYNNLNKIIFCFSLGTKTRDQKKGLRRGTVEKETKDKMR